MGEIYKKLECDLVMRGGITSGIVYPRAIAKLAETYNFRSIGGTSAGAIAAAATAAAAYAARNGQDFFQTRIRDSSQRACHQQGRQDRVGEAVPTGPGARTTVWSPHGEPATWRTRLGAHFDRLGALPSLL